METDVKNSVRQFIREELEWSGPDHFLSDDASLIDGGVIDSLNLLELGHWVSDRYKFKVEDIDMIASNFGTLNAIEEFVRRGKQA